MIKRLLNDQNMVFLSVLLAVRDDKEGQELKHKKVQLLFGRVTLPLHL